MGRWLVTFSLVFNFYFILIFLIGLTGSSASNLIFKSKDLCPNRTYSVDVLNIGKSTYGTYVFFKYFSMIIRLLPYILIRLSLSNSSSVDLCAITSDAATSLSSLLLLWSGPIWSVISQENCIKEGPPPFILCRSLLRAVWESGNLWRDRWVLGSQGR